MHPPSPQPRLQKRRADSPPRPSRQRQPAVPLSPAKLHATNRPRLTVTVSTPNRDSRAASTPLGIREGVYPRLPVSTPSLGIPGIPGTLASSPPSRKRQPTVTVSTPPRDSRAASTPQGIREGVYPRLPVSTPWLGIHGIPGTLTSSPPSKRQPPVTVSTPPRDSRAASTPFGDSRRSLPPSTRVYPLVEDSRDSWDSHKLATFKQETTDRVTSSTKGSAPAITSRRSGFQQQPHDLCSNRRASPAGGTIWYTQVLFKKFALLGPWDQNGGISGPWVRC
jgi:hypothetical protein